MCPDGCQEVSSAVENAAEVMTEDFCWFLDLLRDVEVLDRWCCSLSVWQTDKISLVPICSSCQAWGLRFFVPRVTKDERRAPGAEGQTYHTTEPASYLFCDLWHTSTVDFLNSTVDVRHRAQKPPWMPDDEHSALTVVVLIVPNDEQATYWFPTPSFQFFRYIIYL